MTSVLSRRRIIQAGVATGLAGAAIGFGQQVATAAPAGGAVTSATQYALDSFAGATDDDKLLPPRWGCLGSQTLQQPLVLAGRDFHFTRPFQYYSGFEFIDPDTGLGDAQLCLLGGWFIERVFVNVGTDAGSWLRRLRRRARLLRRQLVVHLYQREFTIFASLTWHPLLLRVRQLDPLVIQIRVWFADDEVPVDLLRLRWEVVAAQRSGHSAPLVRLRLRPVGWFTVQYWAGG